MKKTIIYLTLSLVALLNVFAQQTISWGPVMPNKDYVPFNIVASQNNKIILFTKYDYNAAGNKEYQAGIFRKTCLQVLDNGLKLSETLPMEFNDIDNKKFLVDQLFSIGNKYVALDVIYPANKDANSYAYLIEPSTGKCISEPVILGSVRPEHYKISDDKQKFTMYWYPLNKYFTGIKFKFLTLNADLEKLWTKEVSFPYENYQIAIQDFVLEGEDNLYFYIKLREPYKRGVNEKNSPHPFGLSKVVHYNVKTEKFTEIDIPLENKRLENVKLTVDKDILHISGFYANIREELYCGLFHSIIDLNTKKSKSFDNKEFTEEFVNLFKARKKHENIYRLKDFTIHKVVTLEDNNNYVVAEYCRSDIYTNPNQLPNSSPTSHYANYDIIVFKINSTGKIDWYKRIPKRQYTNNDNGLSNSIVIGHSKKDLFLFYNENEENLAILEKNPNATINQLKKTSPKSSLPLLVKVDEKGVVTKIKLQRNADDNMIIVPTSSIFIKNEGFILFSKSKSTSLTKFGKITL